MGTDSRRRRTIARLAIGVGAALAVIAAAPGAAAAASIAYVDGGDVWLSSLDGQQKVRLATPVVNGTGETENWLAVAASDSGRIVATRNVPGRSPLSSSFKVWEPNGTSTVEGPLNAPSGWATYRYPLGLDVTADGAHMVYGYWNTSVCCPEADGLGTYVRPVTNSSLDSVAVSEQGHPTLFGNRMIAHTGTTVNVQGTSAPPYGADFTPWIDTSGVGLDLRRTDVAANGQLLAFEFEQWNGGSQTIGKISVLRIQGVDLAPTFPAAVDCSLPTAGVATDASLSADATRIAWTDDGGLKVAGAPTTAAEPCVLTSPPVVISPTASQGAIGGTDVAAFLPTPGQPPSGGLPLGAPVVTVPRKVTVKALARAKGVPIKVKVARAGKVKVSGSVSAKVLRSSRSIVVATGSASAKRAGTVTVRLRLTTAARKKRSRLKGARMTLRVTQGRLSTTKRFTLR
ncbi:MAG: hypothetical protein QOE69_695 [Thermoleophilaceae bacterium]|jgi:hypothetical protein|nr:hypothetical protein [Thermoleophilaceae bacterium]